MANKRLATPVPLCAACWRAGEWSQMTVAGWMDMQPVGGMCLLTFISATSVFVSQLWILAVSLLPSDSVTRIWTMV